MDEGHPPQQALPGPLGRGQRGSVLPVALILLCGAVARVAAARGGLWLDEIWSLVIARSAASAWDLLAMHHHDNNHVLESWLLRAMGGVTDPLVVRLPSIAAGIGTMIASGLLARPRGRVDALVAMVLVGGSFPLVQYSSEARGYALAVLFALVAWLALRACLASSRLLPAAAFWACCILGMLSHMTFLMPLVGFAAWSLGTWLRRGGWGLAWRETLRCHAVPLASTAAILGMTLPDMVMGGGPTRSGWGVAAAALSLVVGGPREGVFAILAAAAVATTLVALLIWLRRERDPEWLLFFGAIVLGPGIVIAVARPDFWAERYFLLPATFALLLLARWLGAAMHGMRVARLAVIFVIAVILAGNGGHVTGLIVLGRGDPIEALDFVAGGRKRVATLMSSNDFRTELLLRWRRRAEPQAPPIEHVDTAHAPRSPADWWLVESFDEREIAPAEITREDGARYRLVRTFPHSGLSGWTYLAYRRVDEGTN